MMKKIVCFLLFTLLVTLSFAETPLIFLGETLSGSPDHLVATLQSNEFDVSFDESKPGHIFLCGYLNGILTDVDLVFDSESRKTQMVVLRNSTPESHEQNVMFKSQLEWMKKQYGKPASSGSLNGESYARWLYSDSESSAKGNRQDIVLKETSGSYVEIYFREVPAFVFPGYWDIVEKDGKSGIKKFMKQYSPLENPYKSITDQHFSDKREDAERERKRQVRKAKFGEFKDWVVNLFSKKPKADAESAEMENTEAETENTEAETENTEADVEAEVESENSSEENVTPELQSDAETAPVESEL